MARYGKEHKEATRRRILETAGARFKADGVDGAGVAVLMKDAGLTNGAFYAHFDSKEELVAEVVASEIAAQRSRLATLDEGPAGVEQLVRGYLSTAHRDDVAHGCPSAALLEEIARGGDHLRRTYTDGMLAMVDDITERLSSIEPGSPVAESPRARALAAYALMIGTIQLARALDDETESERLIATGLESVLATLGLTDEWKSAPRP